MSDSPEIFNDHNVYVLGAGFSFDAGLPLVNDFLDRMRESPRWLEENGFEREAKAVASVLDFRLKSAAAAYRVQIDPENIEQLFSLAAARESDSGTGLDRDVTLGIAGTLEYARAIAPSRPALAIVDDRKLDLYPPNWKTGKTLPAIQRWRPLYEFYLGAMGQLWCERDADCRNSVISFNYDLVVEDHLRQQDISFNYGFKPGRLYKQCAGHDAAADIRLLKLHGSVNWSLFDEARIDDSRASDVDPDRIHLFDDFRTLAKAGATPLLIPPTWRKRALGPLSDVWSEAVAAIQSATRIIVIGYSMPIVDQHFKYLLAAGLQDNISLRKVIFINVGLKESNPEASELKRRIESFFRPELKTRQVLEFAPVTVAEFFTTESYRKRLHRKLPAILMQISYWDGDASQL